MKQRKNIIVVFATFLCLTSCTDKVKQAFEESVDSHQLSQLRQFIANNNQANPALLDSARVLLALWEEDSTAYAQLKQEENVLERYQLEQNYMSKYEDGIYFDSVYAMLNTDESIAQEIIEKQKALSQHLEKYRKLVENNIFYRSDDGVRRVLVMSVPDESGKGIGIYTSVIEDWGIVGNKIKFEYEINTEDFDDDDIICRGDNESYFTVEISDRTLWITAQGEIKMYNGERDNKNYKEWLELAKK